MKQKGFAGQQIRFLEDYAKSLGCTKAVLQASAQGRYTWPKLGFKCKSRKQFLDIVAIGKSKGIEIKSELDFQKMADLFFTHKKLKDEDIEMTKKIAVFPVKKDKDKKKSVEKAIQDRSICPVCGSKLFDSQAGTWCLNPTCKVEDDADNYR